MSLRLRMLVLTGLAFVGLFAVLHGSLRAILLRRFADLEAKSVVQDLERARRGLQREIDGLETTCRDWAEWDDAYRFALDHNPEFARVNLVPESFAVLDLDLLVLVDQGGGVVTAIAPAPDRAALHPVPASVVAALVRSGLLGRTADDPRRAGLLVIPEGVLAVASRAILPSQPSGPSHGTLVMGRYLGDATFSSLGDALRLTLTAQRADAYTATGDSAPPAEVLSATAPLVRPLDKDNVAGLAVLADLTGAPGLVLRVQAPRTVYRQGVAAARYLVLTLGVATLLFAAIVLGLLERSVLTPLARLGAEVRAVGVARSPAVRVEETGGGELRRLSLQINEMLAALQQADLERLASEERFRALFERCPLAIFLVDPATWTTVDCNRAALVMTGCARQGLVGSHLGLMEPADDGEPAALVADERLHGLADQGTLDLIGQRRRADGVVFPVEVSASRIAVGKTRLVMTIERDISDRLRLEERFRQSQKLEAVGTLASGVAHNFNNILQVISGLVGVLHVESTKTGRGTAMLDRIEEEVSRASALTSKLIAFAHEPQGHEGRLDLCGAVREAERALAAAAGPHVSVRLVVPPEPVWVSISAHQLTVVLRALADNAREAMPEGGSLTVEVSRYGRESGEGEERQPRSGSWARLSVADTGRGMDEATRQRAFEPFFSTKGLGSGDATGMGLAIVHGIVTQHGSHIEVESAPGRGTIVSIHFPRVEPPRDGVDAL